MPFVSQAQAAYLENHPEKIGGKAKLREWERATKGKHLPKRAHKTVIKGKERHE